MSGSGVRVRFAFLSLSLAMSLALSLFFLVGLTVLGRPGFGRQLEVRNIIAARDEARPPFSAADEQGRSSLPARKGFAGGWGMAGGG